MGKYKPKCIDYAPVNDPKRMHGYRNVRWVENVSRGMRLVGFADKIIRLDHRGWYTDEEFQDETYRGVVYQLPARDRECQYVYGYADPNNEGCALLSFDFESSKEDAARNADRFAEIFAEHERDYQRAWGAGRRYDDLAEEIKDMREEALAIGAEMRAAKRTVENAPRICATLRAEILKLYRSIQRVRKERAELLANYGRQEGFTE